MFKISVIGIIFCISVLYTVAGYCGVVIGKAGITYPISEPDALEEILERARQVDWSKYFNRENLVKMVERFRPEGMRILPPAEKDRMFTVDMTYTLEFDITDEKGNVIYPKGYTFNPLDYVSYPGLLVVINPERKAELEWFKKSQLYNDYRVRLLITDGVPYRLMEKLKRPVYYATAQIIEKLHLSRTPSVIRQNGRVMEVREYAVEE